MRLIIDTAVVAKNFAEFQGNSSLQESAQLFAQGRPVVEMIQAMGMNRRVLKAFSGFESIYPFGGLDRGILEKVILRVSHRNECQFCVESHREITRTLGISDPMLTNPATSDFTPREALALELADAIHRDSNRVPDELFARLRTVFSEPEIVELTFLTGFINMLNWFNNTLGVRYHDEFTGLAVG